MNCAARASKSDCPQQLIANCLVVSQLVLRHVHNDEADPKLREVLLEFEISVNGYENVKLVLRERQKRTILKGAPSFVVNR